MSARAGAEAAWRGTRPTVLGPRRLFAVVDAPPPGDAWRGAVVIAQPIGHELVWSHRALRRLARRLAWSGRAVLRFDGSGWGSSPGESHEFAWEDWVGDLGQALEYARGELHERVTLVGLRVGASLALDLSTEHLDSLAGLVLWQPVADGRAYLDARLALHAALCERLGVAPEEPSPGQGPEVLGFRLGEAAEASLAALRPRPERLPRTLLLVNHDDREQRDLHGALAPRGEVEYRAVEEPAAWLSEPYKMLMPAKSLDAIVDWIEGRDA